MVILTHTPEQCFAKQEYMKEFAEWVQSMRETAEKLKVKIEGAYITPQEHTFYFILECNNYEAVSTFLGPPMLTHHIGKVAPIIDVEQSSQLSFMQDMQQ